MKKLPLTFCLLLAFGFTLFSQDFKGRVYYKSKTSIDTDFGGRSIPEHRKKMILEQMKQMSERNYILSFNKSESIYKEEEKLEQPGTTQRRGRHFAMMSSGGEDYYKNVQNGTYSVSKDLFGKIFLVNDKLPKLKWVMQNETKKIGKYTVYKATSTKKNLIPNTKAMFRKPEDAKEDNQEAMIEQETQITAWYCLDIPINQGPGEYCGLPGLIMELHDGKTSILCSKIELKPKETFEIKKPSKGKKVTQAEFDEISANKMKEMQENFRGRDPGGGKRR